MEACKQEEDINFQRLSSRIKAEVNKLRNYEKTDFNDDYEKVKFELRRIYGDQNTYLMEAMECSERWEWWAAAVAMNAVPKKPYPKIYFETNLSESHKPYKMIKKCLEPFIDKRKAFLDLIDYVLYCFGSPQVKNICHIKDSFLKHFKDTFSVKVFYDRPGDYLGHYLERNFGYYHQQSSSFYTTPDSLCELMNELVIPEYPYPAGLFATAYDCCCGTMRTLLRASNKGIIKIYGQEIDPTIHKVGLINCFLYLPPTVMPSKEFDKMLDERYEQAKFIGNIKKAFNVLIRSEDVWSLQKKEK
jgi:type I restriction-modification system DNA methylase subunit